MARDTHHFFSKLPLFSILSRSELDEILALVTETRVGAGQYLFGMHDRGDAAYVVEQGSIALSSWVDDQEVPLARVGPGEVFGELALLDRGERSASARAVQSSLLFRLDTARFDELKRRLRPAAAKVSRRIARTICARLRDTNEQIGALLNALEDAPAARSQSQPLPVVDRTPSMSPARIAVERLGLFERLNAKERALIANHTHLCGLHGGQPLFHEGTPGMSCFIVVSGDVGVYKRIKGQEEHLAILGPGTIVGQMALIDNAPRSATCKVLSERAVFLELGRTEFDLLFSNDNSFALKVLFRVVEDLVARLRNATERLTEARAAQSAAGARRAAEALVSGHQIRALDVTEEDLSRWLPKKPEDLPKP